MGPIPILNVEPCDFDLDHGLLRALVERNLTSETGFNDLTTFGVAYGLRTYVENNRLVKSADLVYN